MGLERSFLCVARRSHWQHCSNLAVLRKGWRAGVGWKKPPHPEVCLDKKELMLAEHYSYTNEVQSPAAASAAGADARQ